jgi:hypothetical protein
MKKTTFLLVAFMLWGFSFAKAQSVTMYDMTFRGMNSAGMSVIFTYAVPDQNVIVHVEPIIVSPDYNVSLVINGTTTKFTKVNGIMCSKDMKTIFGQWSGRIGTRTHLIRIDSVKGKYVYAFFDDPMEEYNKKLKEKGF